MKEEMKFVELPVPQRKLLLKALGVKNLHCHYCKEKTTIEKCGIMPSLKKDSMTWILCDSILCLSSYIIDLEEGKND